MKEENWEKHENNPFNEKTEVELSFELQDQRRKLQDHISTYMIKEENDKIMAEG